jgi:hypothetical protein
MMIQLDLVIPSITMMKTIQLSSLTISQITYWNGSKRPLDTETSDTRINLTEIDARWHKPTVHKAFSIPSAIGTAVMCIQVPQSGCRSDLPGRYSPFDQLKSIKPFRAVHDARVWTRAAHLPEHPMREMDWPGLLIVTHRLC